MHNRSLGGGMDVTPPMNSATAASEHICCAEPMEPLSESEINFLLRIGWSEIEVVSAGAITQSDVDEHKRNTAKRESMLAAYRKKLRDNFNALVKGTCGRSIGNNKKSTNTNTQTPNASKRR